MNPAASILVQMARDTGRAVATEWDLFLLARQLFLSRGYRGTPIPPRNRHLSGRRARRLLSEATYDPAYAFGGPPPPDRLLRDPDFTSLIYTVCDGDAAKVIIDSDPFAYLSHASALDFYNLGPTSADLHISTPERSIWSAWVRVDMAATLGFDLEDADEDDLPFLRTRPQPAAHVRKTLLHRHETRHPLAPDTLRTAPIRVTPIGMTFRDTLAAPGWCGGMSQVVAIWRAHARNHLDQIVDAITKSDEKIVRVRAGYLLQEALGIEDPRIELWTVDAQRGSSRKLDPAASYAPRFSARWMLSINIDDPGLPATVLP